MLTPLVVIVAGYIVWHGVFLWRVRTGVELSERRLALEVIVDIGVITALLCMLGGWTNPFVSIYLVPLAFAAAMLPLRRALWVVAAGIIGYLVTMATYVPLPELEPGHAGHGNAHLIGMWMSFLLAGVVLVITVAFVRRAYDAERSALTIERESRMRDEHVLSLGVLAASTVHDIGTPLATARLIAEDLVEDGGRIAPSDAEQLCTQLDYAIAQLRSLATIGEGDSDEEIDVVEFCSRVAARFRVLRPDVHLREIAAAADAVNVLSSRPLESAVLSLLVNAAQASLREGLHEIELEAIVADSALTLRIRDYGAGFSTGDHVSLNGMGMGLAISSATLERHGGSAVHYRMNPGTQVVVTLPVQSAVAT